jgi:hypothetical protein
MRAILPKAARGRKENHTNTGQGSAVRRARGGGRFSDPGEAVQLAPDFERPADLPGAQRPLGGGAAVGERATVLATDPENQACGGTHVAPIAPLVTFDTTAHTIERAADLDRGITAGGGMAQIEDTVEGEQQSRAAPGAFSIR